MWQASTLGGCILAALAPRNAMAFLVARMKPLNHPCGTLVAPLLHLPLRADATQTSDPGLLFLTACVHIPDRSGSSPSHTHMHVKLGGVYYIRDEGGYALRTHVLEWPGAGACLGS